MGDLSKAADLLVEIGKVHERMERVIKERDEARAEVDQLKADAVLAADALGNARGIERALAQQVTELRAALATETLAVERLAGEMRDGGYCPEWMHGAGIMGCTEEECRGENCQGIDMAACWEAWARQPKEVVK